MKKRRLRIRTKAANVCDGIETYANFSGQMQEEMLLQSFILEQMTPFNRWLLANQLQGFEIFSTDTVDPLYWLAAWFVFYMSSLFMIYWILSWGVFDNSLCLSLNVLKLCILFKGSKSGNI